MKTCPFCLGKIKVDAEMCRYCDSKLVGELAEPQLAGGKARLLSSLIDLFTCSVGPIFVAFVAGYLMWAFTAIFTWHRPQLRNFFDPFISYSWYIGFAVGIILVLFFQLKWMYKDGQTIGNSAMRIRIVELNSLEKPSFKRLFWLRFLSVFLIVVSLMIYIPYFWITYLILNMILILGAEHRSFHDLIAKTRVIKILKHQPALRPTLKGDGHLKTKHKFIDRFRK